MGYEESFYRTLLGIMSDVERRIRRGHERLFLNAKKEQVRLFVAFLDWYKHTISLQIWCRHLHYTKSVLMAGTFSKPFACRYRMMHFKRPVFENLNQNVWV